MSTFNTDIDDDFLSITNEIFTESVFKDTSDIFYNKVPYENGYINLLFIIGYSGGGKSTMSKSENKFGRDVVDMDKIVLGSSKPDEYFKNMGDFAYSFMTGPGQKYREEDNDKDDNTNLKYASDSYRKSISLDIIDYAKKYAQTHKSIKLVMEGVWIYRYIEPESLDAYAVYIKGTSLATSTERAIKRDNANLDKEGAGAGIKAARTIGKILYQMKDALLGNLEKYQKHFKPMYEAQKYDKVSVGEQIANATKRGAEDIQNEVKKNIDKMTKESEIVKESKDMADYVNEGFLSKLVGGNKKSNSLNNEIEKLKKLKAEGKIDALTYTKKVGELTQKYNQMVNDIKTESSTEKKILDRDTKVGEIDKEIRKTNSDEKKDNLEDKKDNVDKEINSEKEGKSEDIKESEYFDLGIEARRDEYISLLKKYMATHDPEIKTKIDKLRNTINKDHEKRMVEIDNFEKKPVKESESIKKYTGIIERNNERLSEIMESANMHKNEIQGLNEEIENAEKYLHITRMYETASLVKDEFYDEAAHIENEIKPIVDKLNSKGYKVKYASPGHSKLRKKEDNEPDGVYYGKLYSDARVMFADKYDFTAPKYWMHRDVDNCSYLDIIPTKYDKKDGSPDEAFAKWKDSYMESLRKFADELKEKSESSGEPKTEAVADLIVLGTILGAGLISAAVNAYKKAKLEKKWKLRIEAMRAYPEKHKDCPDMTKLKRTKNQMSAFDGSKGKAVDDNDDNAPGNFIYTYTLDGKPVVIVTKEGPRYTSALAKDIPAKYKDHAMYIYSYIMLYKHGWITPRIDKWLNSEIDENEKLKKKNGGKIVDDSQHVKIGKDVGIKKESDESDLNDIYTSTSYMDDTIEDLLKSNGII